MQEFRAASLEVHSKLPALDNLQSAWQGVRNLKTASGLPAVWTEPSLGFTHSHFPSSCVWEPWQVLPSPSFEPMDEAFMSEDGSSHSREISPLNRLVDDSSDYGWQRRDDVILKWANDAEGAKVLFKPIPCRRWLLRQRGRRHPAPWMLWAFWSASPG